MQGRKHRLSAVICDMRPQAGIMDPRKSAVSGESASEAIRRRRLAPTVCSEQSKSFGMCCRAHSLSADCRFKVTAEQATLFGRALGRR